MLAVILYITYHLVMGNREIKMDDKTKRYEISYFCSMHMRVLQGTVTGATLDRMRAAGRKILDCREVRR